MIHALHYQEWLNSEIAPELIDLNLKSLTGTQAYDYLIYSDEIPRRNTGRLSDGYLKRYQHLEDGGWYCSTIDPLTGQESLWGCFKPDQPRIDAEKRKLIKYEHPPKVPTEAFFHRVTYRIGLKIAKKAGVQNNYVQRILRESGAIEKTTETRKVKAQDFGETEGVSRTGDTQNPDKDGQPSTAQVICDADELSQQGCPSLSNFFPRGNLSSSQITPIEETAILSLESEFLDSEDTQFWQWVKENPQIGMIITEGAKKAASLLSAGYCAVALPGIWNGYRQPKDETGNVTGLPYLIPQLDVFATQDREISFCFDHDPNPKTAQNVKKAIAKTAKLLTAKGCKASVIIWSDSEKGVDDLIVAKGHDYFDICYTQRLTLEEAQLQEMLDLSPYVDLTITERYLPKGLTPPKNAKIIGLLSIQGTGKTEWLAQTIEPMLNRGEKVIVIVHREQLAIALANRFGLDYRTEVFTSQTKGIFGYTLCIDSLHRKANPSFNPQDWPSAALVIDEAEQAFWHLLNGETCKKNRVAILKTLKELLQVVLSTGGKVYLADADLSAIAVNYVRSLAGFSAPTWIVKNTCIPNQGKRKCYQFTGNDPSQLVSQLVKKIEKGEKPFILTDGQKHRSKYGTRNLEYDLRKRFPNLKILRIDSESVADPKHPAYGCMGNLDSILKNYDIVIASPTIETGVSIDLKKHFTSVWEISHGVQTVEGVCQGIERLRDHVPRYIWVKGFSPNRVGNGSIDVKTLLASTHKLAETNIRLLQKAGFNEFDGVKYVEEDEEFNGISPSLLTWAKRGCVINYQNRFFRDHVIKKLTAMGYEVIPFTDDDDFDAQLIKQEITLSQQENYTEYCEKVSLNENPTDNEFEELKEKRSKTEEESRSLKKGRLCRRYLTENITTDLIQKDDEGWYAKIRLHYFLTVGNAQLSERDRKYLQKMSELGDGELFKPDVNSSLLSVKVGTLKLLNIDQFLEGQQEFTSNSLQEWFEEISKPIPRSQIKSILGMSINPEKDTPIAVAQRLLGLIGLKMTCLGRFGTHQDSTNMDSPQHNELTMTPIDLETNSKSRDSQSIDSEGQPSTTKNRQRVYRLLTEEPDGRSEIFERWLEKAMSTPCINNEIETGEMAA